MFVIRERLYAHPVYPKNEKKNVSNKNYKFKFKIFMILLHTVTTPITGRSWVRFLAGERIFSPLQRPYGSETHPTSCSMSMRESILEVKRPERDVNH